MAKAKKSRRARRQELERRKRRSAAKSAEAAPPTAVAEAAPADEALEAATSPGQAVETDRSGRRRTINFAQEYAYVFKDVRTVLVISVAMLLVLVGLSFVI